MRARGPTAASVSCKIVDAHQQSKRFTLNCIHVYTNLDTERVVADVGGVDRESKCHDAMTFRRSGRSGVAEEV